VETGRVALYYHSKWEGTVPMTLLSEEKSLKLLRVDYQALSFPSHRKNWRQNPSLTGGEVGNLPTLGYRQNICCCLWCAEATTDNSWKRNRKGHWDRLSHQQVQVSYHRETGEKRFLTRAQTEINTRVALTSWTTVCSCSKNGSRGVLTRDCPILRKDWLKIQRKQH
jgi:hypothetical protein